MEREYKWKADAAKLDAMRADSRLAVLCQGTAVLHMHAVYYETEDGLLREHHAALRFRRENDRGVCCMKLGKRIVGGCTEREEYETEAADLAEGLRRLPAAGAPPALCGLLLQTELLELAHTDFHRTAMTLRYAVHGNSCTAELALDAGVLGNAGAEIPFTEAELEFKDGDSTLFGTFAEQLAEMFALETQPLSKLARAIAASDKEK